MKEHIMRSQLAFYFVSFQLGDESMKRSTLEEIKRLMKFNPSAVLSQDDDRICLDASFDPDNLSVVHDGGNEVSEAEIW